MEKGGDNMDGKFSVTVCGETRNQTSSKNEDKKGSLSSTCVEGGSDETTRNCCGQDDTCVSAVNENEDVDSEEQTSPRVHVGAMFKTGEKASPTSNKDSKGCKEELEPDLTVSKRSLEIFCRSRRKLYDLHKPTVFDKNDKCIRDQKHLDIDNCGLNVYAVTPSGHVQKFNDDAVDLQENVGVDDDDDDDDNDDLNEQMSDEGDDILKPTLLQLSQLVKRPVHVSPSGSRSRNTSDHLPPPPPFCAPPPPPPFPPPLSTPVRSCCLPLESLSLEKQLQTCGPSLRPPTPPPPPPLPLLAHRGPLKKSPISRPRLMTGEAINLEDSPLPGPSNSDNSQPRSLLRQENDDDDGDLNLAREQLRIMIDNLRQFVPLNHPDPESMHFEEVQTALMEFRYLEQALLDPMDYFDFDEYGGFNLDFPRFSEKSVEPAFARGVEMKTVCQICYEDVKLYKRICCDFPVCDTCMEQYIETSVNQGIVKIQCIGICDAFLYRDEILGRLSVTMKDKYYKFLVDANKDPKVKTCPRCSNIHQIDDTELENKTKFGLLVTCPVCLLEWCFMCQAPWHKNIKCKEFRKGDKLVKTWAKEKHFGNSNAQRCPKCKIFIERKGGCDHMTCSKCDTGFCYKCGGRYLDLKFFGNHLSRYSPLGCKYNFKPNRPVLRRFIRGSVFGAKLLGGVVLVTLGVAAVGVLLGASVVILPAFGAYKFRKHRKLKRRLKRQQELIKMRSKNAMMELHRERPYMLDPRHLRERESLREIIVRDEMIRRSNRSAGNDTVHIGIQTGQSQQVDVTVHNPYQPDAVVAGEEAQNSEIRMNITDERGHVTVTTAEISHNSNAGEGSEAEIILHVKTSYPKHEKETKNQASETVETTVVEKPDVTKVESESNADVKDSCSFPKVNSPNGLENRPESAQVHRRAHSTGSVRKNIKKQEFGSISRKWKLKSLSGRKVSEGDPPESAVPSNQDQSESLNLSEEKKPPIDKDDNSETDNLTQSGCFLKLLGKKLNNYQNQIEKDKLSAKSDTNIGDKLNCPDVVSCALKAELKSKESSDTEGQGTGVKVKEKDAYVGVISAETVTTAL